MSEYWQEILQRNQDTCGVWGTHAPTFVVGELTLTVHETDGEQLAVLAQLKTDQQAVVDGARDARDANQALIKRLGIQVPRLLEGALPVDDALLDNVAAVQAMPMDGVRTIQLRGQALRTLWVQGNTRRAALTPAQPPLLAGTDGVAVLVAALAAEEGLERAVSDTRGELSDRRSALRLLAGRVDRNNKRWYVAWLGNFLAGTPEIDALSQIVTEGGGGGGGSTPPPPPPPPPPVLPTAPQNVTVQPGSSGSGAVEVGAEPPPAGQNVTSFNIYDADGIQVAGTATLPVVVAGFTSGAAVTLTVRAVNAAGEGPASEPVTNTAG